MPDVTLEGCRILIVEDEYMLADELAMELQDAGAHVLGPAGTVDKALAIIAAAPAIDVAVLDVNLGGASVFPAADLLAERAIPFLFTTGYDASAIPPRFAAHPRCEKPISIVQVKRAIRRTVRA